MFSVSKLFFRVLVVYTLSCAMVCHAREIPLESLGHLCDSEQHKIPRETATYMKPSNKELLNKTVEIWGKKNVAEKLGKHHSEITKWLKLEDGPSLDDKQHHILAGLLPPAPERKKVSSFKFVDLFAGIGGIRKGFEEIGGECVFTSEWNKYAVQTYKANYYSDPDKHTFNSDIREVTLSETHPELDNAVAAFVDQHVPDHDVLLAGFPCQPFSLAGVSKKNALGRVHGFECKTQGTLFFDVARILEIKQPAAFVLENVKNLKSHDKGRTFRVIAETLDELGYWVADIEDMSSRDPKIIDGKNFIPQHRERIVLVGFRKDLNVHKGFTLKDIEKELPENRVAFSALLDKEVDDKYILTPRLWEYLYEYAKKHRAKGNGFGYGLVDPAQPDAVARTLSARYHKDGSEILIDRGWDKTLGEKDFWNSKNQEQRPRRLTPRECARLMGFEQPGGEEFRIPVSDTQAYRQFGNSVVVPVFSAVARLMKDRIIEAKKKAGLKQKKILHVKEPVIQQDLLQAEGA
ncbi:MULTISPECIES: DNA (cytosine-5-)-methyltransferase [unclassified Endozoicomonas]|uniref:DNA (cytosine-5-)-methyltransferase n=1 Tax=unclassified Endozoicomonas TaxID=2644528 RepID=UPI003BB4C9D5